MHRVNIKEARRLLPKLVDKVRQGDVVEITRRGKKVAVMLPAETSTARTLPSMAEFRATIHPKGKPLSEILKEQRDAPY